MKFYLTLFTAFLLSLNTLAQGQLRFDYQAVLRNPNGTLITNQLVGVRVSILQGSATGTIKYMERHTPTSNSNGLVTLDIGGGTPIISGFAAIGWSTGNYYLRTEIDPAGGTNYTITSVSQLLSVPYSLYAQFAGSSGGHRIGELAEGGIIFSTWHDPAGVEHGLVASLTDLGTGIWANPVIATATVGASYQDGAANTSAIVAALGTATANTAAGVCDAYTSGTYTDWYLPAIWELNQLYAQAVIISTILDTDNDPLTNGLNLPNYWSSTIAVPSSATSPIQNAYSQTFRGLIDSSVPPGTANSTFQNSTTLRGIRAIRRF